MRAELANLNYCAVPFLSRAAVNLCWYYITGLQKYLNHLHSTTKYETSETLIVIVKHIDIRKIKNNKVFQQLHAL